jgi:hypothetical protein
MRKGRHEIQPKGYGHQPKTGRALGNKDQSQVRCRNVKDSSRAPSINFTAENTIKRLANLWTGACRSEPQFRGQHKESYFSSEGGSDSSNVVEQLRVVIQAGRGRVRFRDIEGLNLIEGPEVHL